MVATLNTMTFQNIQAAIALSAGRCIDNANRLESTDFGDCFRNDFWWNDGACFSMLHESKEESVEQAEGAGFCSSF